MTDFTSAAGQWRRLHPSVGPANPVSGAHQFRARLEAPQLEQITRLGLFMALISHPKSEFGTLQIIDRLWKIGAGGIHGLCSLSCQHTSDIRWDKRNHLFFKKASILILNPLSSVRYFLRLSGFEVINACSVSSITCLNLDV